MENSSQREQIIDAALALAAERGWERVRLHDVAARLQLGLANIQSHFCEKEAIIDAWFDRADRAMLLASEHPDLRGLDEQERFARLVMVWLRHLAPYRQVARQMLLGKLEPGHLHYQIDGLLRISRTVQWLREAAHFDAPLPWRAVEETGLTAIYLTTLLRFLSDDSPKLEPSERVLRRLLGRAHRIAGFFRAAHPAPHHRQHTSSQTRAS